MEDARLNRVILRRLEPGRDLLDELSRVVREGDVRLGLLSGIGALKRAAVGMFEQERREYHTTTFDEEMELCALAGNVSRRSPSSRSRGRRWRGRRSPSAAASPCGRGRTSAANNAGREAVTPGGRATSRVTLTLHRRRRVA